MDCSMPGFPVHHQVPDRSRTRIKLLSIESVMPSNHLILCRPLLLLPSIFPTIRFFPKESVLLIRSFNFSISSSNEYLGLISFRIDWLIGLTSLQSKELSRVFSNTTVQKHQFFGAQLSLWRRQWQLTPALLPGKSHGRRSLVRCSLWGH